ncbi:DUF4912 domain-containing protein [Zhaonella formicivorans]|uniref:DUF4912 domain-containing protein n=1 Tax=Zhaonella formicivorans TaxID=2528593 RepID=UPI0010E8F97D|nr:DUF4912 domain-containing protein [Zhaonella formicivorans]
MLTLLTFIIILLFVVVASFTIYSIRNQAQPVIQKKPLLGTQGHGYADTEFAEEIDFHRSKEESDFTWDEPDYFLPTLYGESKAVLLVKDPYWIYAYWDIGEEAKKEFVETTKDPEVWSKSSPVLRVYNVTNEPLHRAPYFDIPIHDEAANWYIKVGKPKNSFIVEVGRTFEGSFYPLVRSNQVSTPADGVSEIIDPEWPPHEIVWQSLHSALGPSVWPSGSTQMEQKH